MWRDRLLVVRQVLNALHPNGEPRGDVLAPLLSRLSLLDPKDEP
jgi:hypothetical protein